MSADYSQLLKFNYDLKRLTDIQMEQYIEGCVKEIAARLLNLVIHRTPVGVYEDGHVGGTLRRGWTTSATGDSKRDTTQAMYENIFGAKQKVSRNDMEVRRIGNSYIITIANPVEYASYVEYGHRTRNHTGWVDGKFMLTISEQEVNGMTQGILEKRLRKMLKDAMG